MRTPNIPVKKARIDSLDEKTNKRIHEHLTNKDDVISEADIENAKTDITITDKERVILNDEFKEINDEKIKDNSDVNIELPWNILDS